VDRPADHPVGADAFCSSVASWAASFLVRRKDVLRSKEIAQGVPEFSGWAINVRCLEGVDLDTIPVKRVYGSKLY
jgi:hypothetical protein